MASNRIRNIFVSPRGHNAKSCGNASEPCLSLDFAISIARESGENSTQITAAEGNYTLNESYTFTNVENFGLNCGGWKKSSVYAKKPYRRLNGANFKTALDFRYCKNIRFYGVEISSSSGLAVNCFDCGGAVNFTNSVFAENAARSGVEDKFIGNQNEYYVLSGGGVYLGLDPYGSNTVNVTPGEHDSFQHNNTYIFRNCRFVENEAVWLNESKQSDFFNSSELPFSRGGGLAIFFRSNASGCLVDVESCAFIRNRADWGGGLMLVMKEESRRNVFVMAHTLFVSNKGNLAGGGIRIGNFIKGSGRGLNTFSITNCSFEGNKAIWGGGASIFGTTIPDTTKHDLTQFYFNNCHWSENNGTVGAAVAFFLSNQNEDQIGPEIPYHVTLNFSTFQGNRVIPMEQLVTIGEGTLYSVQVPLIFRGNVTFFNNTNSAMALDGSTMEIFGNVFFIKNKGFRGGAIAMYGRSRIVLKKKSYLLFDDNKSDDRGGALYIFAPGPPLVGFYATGINTHICFFGYTDPHADYDDWETRVIFVGNKAAFAGHSVFATTLRNCRRPGESLVNNSVLQWKFVEFRSADGQKTSLTKEVTTEPVKIKFDTDDWLVAPSEVFNASLSLLDEIGNSVVGSVSVKVIPLQHEHPVSLNTSSPLFIANRSISYVKLAGKADTNFSVKLWYMGRVLLTETISNLTLKPCNPGFKAKDDQCVCMDSTDVGVHRCESDGKTFYLTHGYWAGLVKEKFKTHFCPTGYCNITGQYTVEQKYDSGNLCSKNRNQTSVLCGKCNASYSVLFGGEDCSNTCTNWYLLLLIVYGVILLLVVMGVMLINLDFFTGYLNAWVYSYQVMKVITPGGFQFDCFIEFLIGLGNFKFKIGGGICFAAGLDDADKLAIMYVLPTFVLVLVMLLARAVGNHPNWWFSKRVRAPPFRAFCTIFVLCYTDITRISLRILNYAKFDSTFVMYANGNIGYFSQKHIAYGILAILYILIVVIPFPMILLFRSYLTRKLLFVVNLNRWKPIFDALQSCFKDQYRWCAAFYFLCRFVLLAISTLAPPGAVKRAMLETACVLILLIFAFLRPYKEASDVKEEEESYEWINKSDVALLTTLSLIAIFSSAIDSRMSIRTRNGLRIFVRVLAYIPLLVLGMVTYRTVSRWRQKKTLRNELQEPELSVTDETTETDNQPA
ncbi:hypothetical protein AWC38_SpisGene801 [Stylophora pistillata]|uniref:Uncharacterized protein n=1 Tax=Stylophora pistillata TaxID=50429 RepID=A0A2B4SZJ5_STYPI|nr:hypothetical protein AWC38_SpisGene801 [Stylophora pistillata]